MKGISIIVIFITVAISGCASKKHDLMIQDMERSIKNVQDRTSAISKAQSEGAERMEELNARIIILESKLGDIDRNVGEIKTQTSKLREEVAAAKAIKEEEPGEQPVATAEEKQKETAEEEEKVSSPDVLYKEGQDLLNAGKKEEALGVFKSLVKHYSKSSLADNALYWMGEIHFSNKDYPAALVEFNKVVNDYPGENKAPDALLKLSFSHQQMGEKEKATAVLKELIARYPRSEAAKKARSRVR